MTVTVLAGSYQETNAFARQKGLGYGVRHIVNAKTLEGARPTEIHVLPSFYTRRDFHAVNAMLKRVVRKAHQPRRIEYELQRTGIYVVASEAKNSLEATKSAEPPAPADPKVDRVNALSAPDTSKDAVPGQIPIGEALKGATPAEDPLAFLDD